jgi:hypothetical protein
LMVDPSVGVVWHVERLRMSAPRARMFELFAKLARRERQCRRACECEGATLVQIAICSGRVSGSCLISVGRAWPICRLSPPLPSTRSGKGGAKKA